MAILRTLHWWVNSVEKAVISLRSYRLLKLTWESGKEGSSHKLNPTTCKFFIYRLFSNSFGSGLGLGFQIEYQSTNVSHSKWSYMVDECRGGGYFSTAGGIITSPSYPEYYPDSADCIYTISQPIGSVIMLNFLSMDIQSHDSCNRDYLEIRDGPSGGSDLLDKLCGRATPDPIQSSQNQLWMKWG